MKLFMQIITDNITWLQVWILKYNILYCQTGGGGLALSCLKTVV